MINTYDISSFSPVFVTCDLVVINKDQVLLIQRKLEPFKNRWALPGGFFDVSLDRDISAAAIRELKEETYINVSPTELKLIGVFSEKNRDPREALANKPCRIVSIAYLAQLNFEINNTSTKLKAGDDAAGVGWFSVDNLPDLAFDHAEIINLALHSL
jgi:8-oxo-dGTP diphosphatase